MFAPQDGNVKCHHEDPDHCPPLSCPESEQFREKGECCFKCPATTPDPQTEIPTIFDLSPPSSTTPDDIQKYGENLVSPRLDCDQNCGANQLCDPSVMKCKCKKGFEWTRHGCVGMFTHSSSDDFLASR